LTVSGQDGRTSYRTSTPGRGSIFNIEKISNSQKIEKDSNNYFDDRRSEDDIKKEENREEKKEIIENVNSISEISNYRIKSLLSIKNTDLTSYSPYLCVRSDGQISFENISNKSDGHSFTFYLRIIPEFDKFDNYNIDSRSLQNLSVNENENTNGNKNKYQYESINENKNRNNENLNTKCSYENNNHNYISKNDNEHTDSGNSNNNFINKNSNLNSKIILTEDNLRCFHTDGYLKISNAVNQNAIASCLR
jgi:hypothetical protein